MDCHIVVNVSCGTVAKIRNAGHNNKKIHRIIRFMYYYPNIVPLVVRLLHTSNQYTYKKKFLFFVFMLSSG